ncbi:MAG: S8 family serine peptidase [Anaerolineae bacterium]
MRGLLKPLLAWTLLFLLLLAPTPGPAWADEGPLPEDGAFLAAAAQVYGAEANTLEVEHKTVSFLPDGRPIYWAKVWDALSGQALDVALDGDLRPLSAGEAEVLVADLHAQAYGKLSEALSAQVQALGPADLVEVAIALHTPDGLDVARPSEQEEAFLSEAAREALWNARIQAYQEQVAAVERPLVEELLAAGLQVVYVSPDVPLLLARLPKDALLSLAQHPAVAQVWSVQAMEEEINTVKRTVRATRIWPQGANGRGVKVGVSEVGAKARDANPYLTFAWNEAYESCGYSSHGTAVAGIIGAFLASDPVYRGMAFRSSLYYHGSCIGYWDRLVEGWQELRYKGVAAINSSWGADGNSVPDYTDMEIDTYVRNYGKFMTKSAGNRAPGFGCPYSDGDVTNPGLGYNVMTVGNFDHKRTATWTDDTMEDTCSSYRDPKSAHGDREKPEVAAPGTDIHSTLSRSSAPWIGEVGSGTSYAAPVVAALAADLISKEPKLQGWPEVIKAILMASARNPVGEAYRGANGKGLHMSESAGAGGVDFEAALQILNRQQGGWARKTVYYSTFGSSKYFAYRVRWQAGKKVRVALVWDTNPLRTTYNRTSQPSSDLDLRIFKDGQRVAYSTSYDNTFEVVEFMASTTGVYEIRIYLRRWDEGGTSDAYRTYMGLAWRYE